MIKQRKRTREEVQYWQELKRSSAASKHVNKSKYTRKTKHKEIYV